jgi:hypothetical protein
MHLLQKKYIDILVPPLHISVAVSKNNAAAYTSINNAAAACVCTPRKAHASPLIFFFKGDPTLHISVPISIYMYIYNAAAACVCTPREAHASPAQKKKSEAHASPAQKKKETF